MEELSPKGSKTIEILYPLFIHFVTI